MRPSSCVRERLSVPARCRLARRVRGRARPRQVGGAAAGDHDAPPAALEHPRNDRAAGEVDAEHVRLEDAPPLVEVSLPRCVLAEADAGVRDEQVDRIRRRDHPLDVLPLRDVADDRCPADLVRDRLDLLGRPAGDGDVPAVAGELPGDVRADPAAASGDKCSRRHSRSPPGSRGSPRSRGRRDPRRARSRGRRAGRSWPSASSAAPRRRERARARTPSPALRRRRP